MNVTFFKSSAVNLLLLARDELVSIGAGSWSTFETPPTEANNPADIAHDDNQVCKENPFPLNLESEVTHTNQFCQEENQDNTGLISTDSEKKSPFFHYQGVDYPKKTDKNGVPGVDLPVDGYGVNQTIGGAEWEQTLQIFEQTREYVNVVRNDDKYNPSIRDETCKLRHELCCFWAGMEECSTNPVLMNENCAPSCQTW